MHGLRFIGGLILCCFLGIQVLSGQDSARIAVEGKNHDFGTIKEEGGLVTHLFTVKNVGTESLVIKRVLASCGCTKPEWTTAPIAPGKTGEVWVSYDPKGRPGPFYKTINIMSNAADRRFTLSISGEVIPEPEQPAPVFNHKIGTLELSEDSLLFAIVPLGEKRTQSLWVKNTGEQPVRVRLEKLPAFLTLSVRPDTLKPGAVGEMSVSIHPGQSDKKGHFAFESFLAVYSKSKKVASGRFSVMANLVDNFSKLTAGEKVQSPSVQLSGTVLKFGKLKEQGSFFGLFGNKATGTVEIANSGQSPLLIYSITTDQHLLELENVPKKINAGRSAVLKVGLNPKKLESPLNALITIVCNDPNGPVRQIKVMAEKQ